MSGSSLISPKSPPSGSLDLYGKRRQMARVQLLEREIASLQDELKSVEGVQAASVCCKELDDFVRANSDPLLLPPGQQEGSCVSHQWWKRFRRKLCCEVSSICCCSCSCFSCSGKPCTGLCCNVHGCAPEKTLGSCCCCHCCPRTPPSCSGKCKCAVSCCKLGVCPHSCCLP